MKNLISISTIEDRGFEVVFQDGWVLFHPKGSSVTTTKVIEIRQEKLYRLMFHIDSDRNRQYLQVDDMVMVFVASY